MVWKYLTYKDSREVKIKKNLLKNKTFSEISGSELLKRSNRAQTEIFKYFSSNTQNFRSDSIFSIWVVNYGYF